MTDSIDALYEKLNRRLSCNKRSLPDLIIGVTSATLGFLWHKAF